MWNYMWRISSTVMECGVQKPQMEANNSAELHSKAKFKSQRDDFDSVAYMLKARAPP
jgi:hypothetical protein